MKKLLKTTAILTIWALVSFSFFCLQAQTTVSNVKASFTETNVTVNFKLETDYLVDIILLYSNDNGINWPICISISGDIKQQSSGNKTIVWDCLKDGIVQGDFLFKVSVITPSQKIRVYSKKTFFEGNFSWSPQPQMAYGFTVGQFKRVGWYISLMSNFNFKRIDTELVSNEIGYVDGELPFYSGNTSTTRISATVGFIGKIVPPWAIYVGAGIGNRALYWETKDNQWVKNGYYSILGVDVETGFLFDIKGFMFSAGVVTTNFKSIDLKVGIGWAFKHKNNKQK